MPSDSIRKPGEILLAIAEQLPETLKPIEVRLGLHLTLASTPLGTGLAATAPNRELECCQRQLTHAGRFTEISVSEILRSSVRGNDLERSVAVALINASLDEDIPRATNANAVQLVLEKARDKNVAVVGHFPFVDGELPALSRKLQVFQLPERMRQGDLPADAMKTHLPDAELVVITGTTLISQTLEQILAWCDSQAYVIMMGATTPLHPLLFDLGIDALCGVTVGDPLLAARLVSEGCSIRQFAGIEKVIYYKP